MITWKKLAINAVRELRKLNPETAKPYMLLIGGKAMMESEKKKEYQAKYRAANRERLRELGRKWREAHPDYQKERRQNALRKM